MKKAGRNGTWKKTPFSTKVKKKLIDKDMKMVDLARAVGSSPSYLSQVIFGIKKDEKCVCKIVDVLGLKEGRKNVS